MNLNINDDNIGLTLGILPPKVVVPEKDHNKLLNRDLPNQHPIKSIEGLKENGEGTKFLSDDGTYKDLTELVLKILKEQGLISSSLTEEEIQALNNMTCEIDENGNLIINYNDEVLNISFSIEDKNLIVTENIDANFSINETGEMEVSY